MPDKRTYQQTLDSGAQEAKLAELTQRASAVADEIANAKALGLPTAELLARSVQVRDDLELCIKECEEMPATAPAEKANAQATDDQAENISPCAPATVGVGAGGEKHDGEPIIGPISEEQNPRPVLLWVQPLPMWSQPRLEAWLKRNNVPYSAARKNAQEAFAVLEVTDEDAKQNVRSVLSSLSINGRPLTCSDTAGGPPEEKLPPPPPRPPVGRGTEARSGPAGNPQLGRSAAFAPDYDEELLVGSSSRLIQGNWEKFPKRQKLEKNIPSDKRSLGLPDIRDSTAHLWRLPYSEQLGVKYAKFLEALDSITWGVALALGAETQPEWLAAAKQQATPSMSPCCPPEGILRSPQTHEYRNKAEFTIGYDEAKQPTAGMLYGLFRDGFLEVGDPSSVPHISPTAKAWAALMTRFLRSDASLLPAWDKGAVDAPKKGFWRLLVVREGRNATYLPPPASLQQEQEAKDAAAQLTFETLDIAQYRVAMEPKPGAEPAAAGTETTETPVAWWPKDEATRASLDAAHGAAPAPDSCLVMVDVNDTFCKTEAEVQAELQRWAEFVSKEAPKDLPLTSLMVRYNRVLGNAAPADAPTMLCPGWSGTTVGLEDTLLNFRFQISPTGFFQTNSAAAACLYKLVGEWAAPTPNTLLFDTCCGAGTIGMTLASRAKRVIGVDIIRSSIEAARAAAAANGIANCEFHCGSAESLMESLLEQCDAQKYDSVVAIVDPPRSGLHKAVIYSLLACRQVSRIVYVSCNPESLASNAKELCMPPAAVKRRHIAPALESGRKVVEAPKRYVPFVPKRCHAVDMFPHTAHVEAVLLMER